MDHTDHVDALAHATLTEEQWQSYKAYLTAIRDAEDAEAKYIDRLSLKFWLVAGPILGISFILIVLVQIFGWLQ